MLHLGALNLLSLLSVAGDAEFFRACLRQDDFAVLGRLMANLALPFPERQVHKSLHQFRPSGLVWIVAGQAICLLEGLILVGFDQRAVFCIMAVHAKPWCGLCQVIPKFTFGTRSRLVIDMAGITTRIERQMAAAFFGHVQPDAVAAQAKIILLVSRSRLEQLILVIGRMWVVALQAVAHRGAVDGSLDLRSILVRMAGEAEAYRSR